LVFSMNNHNKMLAIVTSVIEHNIILINKLLKKNLNEEICM
jgi:hypothetical protein